MLLQTFLSDNAAALFRAWLTPQEAWPEEARSKGLLHSVSSWSTIQPIATAVLEGLPAREAVHFLPQLSSLFTAAAVHTQRCIQAASFRAERAQDAADAAEADAQQTADALQAAADECAVTGMTTQAKAVTWILRRVPGLFAKLPRKNVAFFEDVCMFVRHVIVAQVCCSVASTVSVPCHAYAHTFYWPATAHVHTFCCRRVSWCTPVATQPNQAPTASATLVENAS
jgi:hypothetical protein